MNKIFKVIWSKSKQCYIVVSEMAKNHSGKKKIVVASILAAMAVGSETAVVEVQAGAFDGGQIGSYYATAIGYKANAFTDSSIAIGTYSYSKGTQVPGDAGSTVDPSIAIGNKARAVGNSALAVGMNATADNSFGVAVGRNTEVTGDYGVGIGFKSKAALHGIGIGEQARAIKEGATTLGVSSRGYGKGAIAIGWQSLAGADVYTVGVPGNDINSDSASKINDYNNWGDMSVGLRAMATGGNATALGRNAAATATNAVAIGGGNGNSFNDNTERTVASGEKSAAIGYNSAASGTSASALGTKASASAENAAAIGTSASASAKDTFAAGSSAAATAEGATAVGKAAKAQKADATSLGSGAIASEVNATALGKGATASKADATAVGSGATASEANAVAIGKDAEASKGNAIAIGKEAEATEASATAIGDGANAEKANAVAIGKGAISGGTSGIAVGNDAQAQAADTIAVGSSSRASSANDSAFGNAAKATGGGSTAIGYTVNASGDQSFGAGSNTSVSGTAAVGIGYQVTASGNRSISIGADYQGKKTTASAAYTVAMGTGAQASATSAVAIGTNASAGLEHSVALGEGSTTTSNDGTATTGYLTNEPVSNSGNGVIAIGNKRNDKNDTGTILRRIVGLASGTNDYDAANIKQLKALESNERHIKAKTGNDAYKPDATGTITLNYVNGKGEDVAGEIAEITDVAKKSDEWTLRTQDGNTTTVATPQTVNGLTKKAVTLKAGDNIAIENSSGTVTIKAKNVVTSITSGNSTALTVNPSNGAVTITPNIASSVGATGEDGKLVTSGKVKAALDDKIDKTAEMHIKTGEYTVDADGKASLTQQNGNNQDQSTRVVIKDIAKKSVVDGINTTVNTHTTQITNLTSEVGGKVSQSDFDTFKAKAITFTGDDNAGVARTLDTTLTVKGGANYTSTTANTNIRVEKDGSTGASGLLVKLSDKLSGMKEIAGDGKTDLVIKNGTNTVTITPGKTGDNGTVNFGNAKVVASNLEADITYRANGVADTAANTVKLKKGLNFTAATDTNATTDGPKSGLSITTGADGLVTFGLDKATRSKVDNAADKNLSNLSDDGKGKVTELAKAAAKEAVKVAPGINTTVDTDTTTTAGVTTYKVNANDTTVAVTGDALAITGGDLGTDKARKYSLDLSDASKAKLKAVSGLATIIGGTNIAADGTVTGPSFNITKADGSSENATTLKDAIDKLNATNAGQNSKISETAGKVGTLETNVTNLGNTVTNLGNTVTNLGNTVTSNYNDLSNKITQAGAAATTAATAKGLNFTGDDTTDNGKVHRDLGETLTIKGGENFTRGANENNIKVVKNDKALDVKLAENLGNIKEIAGDGTHDLVIKNGDTKVNVKAPKDGDKGSIDFGDTKLVASNLDASIKYRANDDAVENAKSVKLADGFNYVASKDVTTTAEGPKSGLAITTEDNGKVTFGLDKATREKVDNAADKNLSNLSDDGKDKVKELAKTAAQDAVKVAPGINTTVDTDRTTTAGVTTYKVNANDTTVAVSGTELTIDGGTPDATTKIRAYTLGLSDATKGKLAAVGNLANVIGGTTIAADGTVTGPTFNITKADGTGENATTLKDAIDKLNATNAGQNTKISETAGKVTTLEGKVTDLGTTVTNNYNDLSNKITQATTAATTAATTKGLNFTGDDTTDTGKVHRDLGETLSIKGGENFTRESNENNIKVVKNDKALDVKLAENLGNIKEIAGDGKTDLVIKNGDTKVTVKAPKDGEKGSIDFGNTKLVASNLDASIKYRANDEAVGNAKSVKLADGFNYVASNDATTTAEGPKSGLAIKAEDNGKVTFGLDKATRTTLDNAASKEYVENALTNLNSTITGNANLNFAGNVTKDAQNKAADKIGLALATGTLHVNGDNTNIVTTAKGDTITVELAQAVKDQLAKVGDTASNGRDGVHGTSGAQGLTGADGLNNATLNDKVNALRNGEAGSVVYTNDAGDRVVKAKDGKYYKAEEVKADGTVKTAAENNNKEPQAVDNPQARVVNGNGDTKTATTLSNIADGKVAANSKEAVNGGQLHTVKSDLATALGGDSKVNTDGSFTGPTYNITKDDGTNGTEPVKNVGDAISKLDTRINNANSTLATKGLDFYGNKDIADTDKVHRNLGEALKVKGAENFARAEGAKNNIDVVKNAAGDGFDVKLAENLANMKEIAGDGTHDLVIKNGDTKVTVKAPKAGNTGSIDFGDTKLVANNLDASIKYRANDEAVANAKSVKLADGFNYVVSNDATTTAEGPKSGLAITAEDNGKVTFGLDKDTRSKVDNAADKNLSNLSDAGKDKVKELAKDAAKTAVKVADGINTTVTTDTTTTVGTTIYKVNANDTTVAVNGDALAISGGTPDATSKVRAYTLDLSDATKGKLAGIGNLANVIGGTTIATDGTVTGPTFNITKADGTSENATTLKDAIDKLNATNEGQNSKLSETAGKVTDLAGKVNDIVDKGMTFIGDDATADKVARKLGETLNIHGQNNITVKKDGTDATTLNVKLASDLKNITSITNADADDKPGSKITIGGDSVTITNTQAPAAGATTGETKTVTIGKDGINAGNMNITNVAEAKNDGDAANKKYVDDEITKLQTTVTNNANLNFAGNVTKDAQDKAADKVGLSLATGTLHVNGDNTNIVTTAKGDTITVELAQAVKDQLAKVGDTASNGRDGKDGVSGSKGLTGADGLNNATLNDKVNALRNGEAGSVVYTNEAGDRVVKAKDGKYYKADEVKVDGTVKTADENNGKAPQAIDNPQARVVNGNGDTKTATTLSNIADGKVAANSKEAVNGGQLHTVKSDLATALGGDSKVNTDGSFTGPTYNITKDDGTNTTEEAKTVGDAISKLDSRINNANSSLATKGLDFYGNKDTADTDKVHRNLGEALKVKGAENFTRAGTNNIDVVKNTAGDGFDVKLAENLVNMKEIAGDGKTDLVIKNGDADNKPGSKITIGGDGVTITNTQAPVVGATTGETKTVTIGKDGINAGNMNITNVGEAKNDGDVTNKQYVDKAINKLGETLTNNATLNFAGNVTKDAQDQDTEKVGLSLAKGTLHVNGDNTNIVTTAKGDTITVELAQAVKDQLAKVGDTASNGRDGKDGVSGAKGLTGADGLNNATLNDKVNALRNGEAGSLVYTNDAGDRVVKAKDGKYYKADEVKADGTVKTADENNGKAPQAIDNPQARVVNGNGDTKAPTILSNIADGKVAANSKEAVNGGQLHTVKSDLATALGGDSKVNTDGSFTGPTYNITKDDGTNTTEEAKTVGDAISKLDSRINNANSSLATKGLDFYGNKDTADTDKVHRNLGEALKVKGAENFARAEGTKNNIDVVKNTAGDGFDVKLAENLANMKEIAGDGKTDLVIKNGDATITLKPAKPAVNDPATGDETTQAKPATVDFGDSNVVAKNLDATITYRANNAEDTVANTVKLKKGLNFVAGTGTVAPKAPATDGTNPTAGTTTATSPTATTDSVATKKGIAISTDVDGVVNIGLDSDTRSAIDNAANQDLSNLTTAGKKAITDAAQGAVKVAAGNNVTVDTETKDNVTTYTVNGRDTTVKAATGGSVSVTGGNLNANGEREYTVDLTDAAKAEINRIAGIDTRLTTAEGNITTLQGDMTKAKADIVTNAGNIATNAGNIATNKANIAKNAGDIATNAGNIATNTKNIATNATNIAKNAGDIATNAGNIKTNATNIGKNAQAIQALQGNSATKDLNNLTNAGKDVVTGLVNVVGTNGITVTNATDDTSRVKTFTAKLDDKVTFGKDGNKITIDGTTGTITAPNATINVVNTNTIQAGDANTTNTAVTPEGVTVTTKQPDGTVTSTVMIKDGAVSGLTNTKWDPTKVTDTDRSKAATQGQVKDISDTLQKGRVFAADTGVASTTVALGDTLAIKGGATGALTDHNIGVELTAANGKTPATMAVRLAKNVEMKDGSTSYNYYLPEVITKPDGTKEIAKNADGTVKYQTDKTGNPINLVTTTVNGEGVTIAPVKGLNKPSVSLTADGLDNGGNAIHHVGPGTAADDAATLGQVVAAASAMSRQVNQTGAHAAALAAMNPLSYDPLKKSQVMAGYGAYKGNSALALGVAHYANEDTLFNVGVSVGNGENMVNAGMTYRFGGEDSMIPERYKGGPISSVYVMQDEITALKAENARKDAENAKKDAENEEMKAQIKMLIERVTMLEAKK